MEKIKGFQISSMTVSGFKCYEAPMKITFGNPTIVTGGNGRGKSSLADAIAFAVTGLPFFGERGIDRLHNETNPDLQITMRFTDDTGRAHELTRSRQKDRMSITYDGYAIRQTDLNEMFGRKYPKYFRPEHVKYYKEQSPDELALINYTSGTTGFSKGVMIPYRALWSNFDFAGVAMGKNVKKGDNVLSILPMAHMYGLAFEFIYEFLNGCHIYYLSRLPSPAVIAQAFADIKPAIIIAVPLVIEKIIRKKVFPKVQTPRMNLLLNMPGINKKVRHAICEQVKKAFGGNFYEVIIGGAAFNQEVEQFLHRINFPYTVGYGATECAPIICYAGYEDFVPGSCGRAVVHNEVRIASSDPANIPGEILVRGLNVMLGYYKNEEATRLALDSEGWYHTGDLGVMDEDGNVFIKGRSKYMLLGASGQNIYPEEIEDKLNSMNLVSESIVIQEGEKLVGLVYPDMDEAKQIGLSMEDLKNVMEENRKKLNAVLPSYCKLVSIRLHDEEFEKTPKKSIKRFLYLNMK